MPSRRERDFIAYFNGFWYRDFPTIEQFADVGRRAVWTSHLASVVKHCADLMGAFTCYETGNRTDAVIQLIDPKQPTRRKTWAKVEWEWKEAHGDDVNEITKLAAACAANECDTAIFIGFCKRENIDNAIRLFLNQWKDVNVPLLCFLIEYGRTRLPGDNGQLTTRRKFETLHTFRLYSRNAGSVASVHLRDQPALPWDVKGSRWMAAREIARAEQPQKA